MPNTRNVRHLQCGDNKDFIVETTENLV